MLFRSVFSLTSSFEVFRVPSKPDTEEFDRIDVLDRQKTAFLQFIFCLRHCRKFFFVVFNQHDNGPSTFFVPLSKSSLAVRPKPSQVPFISTARMGYLFAIVWNTSVINNLKTVLQSNLEHSLVPDWQLVPGPHLLPLRYRRDGCHNS